MFGDALGIKNIQWVWKYGSKLDPTCVPFVLPPESSSWNKHLLWKKQRTLSPVSQMWKYKTHQQNIQIEEDWNNFGKDWG